MMNKLLITILISINTISCASKSELFVKMPSAQILSARLAMAGFLEFNQRTQIAKKLADCVKRPLDIPMEIDLSLYDYHEHMSDIIMSTIMYSCKNKIYEALLGHCPEALKELEDVGIYSPTLKR